MAYDVDRLNMEEKTLFYQLIKVIDAKVLNSYLGGKLKVSLSFQEINENVQDQIIACYKELLWKKVEFIKTDEGYEVLLSNK